MEPLILASTSPRRKELLDMLGLSFRVLTSSVDETTPPDLPPSTVVELLAERKARAVAENLGSGLVIGADTIVVWQGQILGKPVDSSQAATMLRCLQGSMHEVFTGLAVVNALSGKTVVIHERTKVTFRRIEDKEILSYVATGEPMDKAGAYAVQGIGAIFIQRIEGCYTNVVGLPLARLAEILKQFNYNILL
ncbi:MAG: septum formation inhibitor Maf [Peptococcaceae bacterium]|nr:MAG: septum formation inhibitor Maf [Peptococcaceae bacterium]